ncbi:hypothetical protein, partial [Klebsiella michiganensis]|uniref:hypothetical protein n=1 Tax=Klebsiella michiganensis TaxID=1134687 RepID=UPI0019538BF8
LGLGRTGHRQQSRADAERRLRSELAPIHRSSPMPVLIEREDRRAFPPVKDFAATPRGSDHDSLDGRAPR